MLQFFLKFIILSRSAASAAGIPSEVFPVNPITKHTKWLSWEQNYADFGLLKSNESDPWYGFVWKWGIPPIIAI